MNLKTTRTILLMLFVATCVPVQASEQGLNNDYLSVRELMRLETEQALEAMRARKAQGSHGRPLLDVQGQVKASTGEGSLRLAGIYGVGQRLFAEVRHGARAWLFLKGQPLPVGHDERTAEFRLRELSGYCIRLERQGEEVALCLPVGGRS